MSQYSALKEEAYTANMQLRALGLVLFTFGNASAEDWAKAVFAIKPSGVPYADLRPEDLVIWDYKGDVVEGRLRPSSDTKTHAVLYGEWENIGGVVHAHSTYGNVWAQAVRNITIFGTTHVDHLVSDVPCAPPMNDTCIKGDYERMTGHHIIECIEERKLNYMDAGMVLVESHAPLTWGKDAAQPLTLLSSIWATVSVCW